MTHPTQQFTLGQRVRVKATGQTGRIYRVDVRTALVGPSTNNNAKLFGLYSFEELEPADAD